MKRISQGSSAETTPKKLKNNLGSSTVYATPARDTIGQDIKFAEYYDQQKNNNQYNGEYRASYLLTTLAHYSLQRTLLLKDDTTELQDKFMNEILTN